MVFLYTIFLLPIIIGFAIIGNSIWGPYITEFSSFTNSF